MPLLITGLVLFFAIHLLRVVAPSPRGRLIERVGPLAFKALYAVFSLIGLVLMVQGYAAAKAGSAWLWYPPVFTRHLGAAVMLPVMVLLVAAYLPGRIRRTVKHPMTVSVLLWAAVHLVANGQLADVVLFGSWLVWSMVVLISSLRRAEPSTPPSAPPSPFNDLIAVATGVGLWAALAFWGHRHIAGMPVFG